MPAHDHEDLHAWELRRRQRDDADAEEARERLARRRAEVQAGDRKVRDRHARAARDSVLAALQRIEAARPPTRGADVEASMPVNEHSVSVERGGAVQYHIRPDMTHAGAVAQLREEYQRKGWHVEVGERADLRVWREEG